MLEEEHRIQALVHRLLELAGAESSGRIYDRQPVRLDELVGNCAAELAILAEPRGQRLEWVAAPATTVTDPVLLQQALRNLIDNALKYSPDGATVRITLREEGAQHRIEVVDQGPGIPSEHRARLAERFFRAGHGGDKARPGFGLGLSITKVYMRVLGGALLYERADEGGSRFSLILPKGGAGPVATAAAV